MPFLIYNFIFNNHYYYYFKMRLILLVLVCLLEAQVVFGQEEKATSLDSLYKEDQFYIGVTYNLLANMPKDMSQNGFSSGFHLGFIKDMPINENRNWSLGIGLGYSTNSVNQNLLISADSQDAYTYEIIESSQFTKNKFSQHLVEVPFEIRWRTSTLETYKFWRIYTGFKLGYVFASNTKFKGTPQNNKMNNIDDFEKLQYGLTLAVGYNTWNAYLYYGLNSIFKNEAKLDGKSLDIRAIKIGLIFYIL